MNIISQILIVSFLLGLTAYPGGVAAVSSPDPVPVAEEITENLKNRLKQTINSVEANSETTHIGFVGKVRDIVKNTLVVEDKSGKKNVLIDDDTDIVRSPGNTSIKLDSVRIGDAVIAIVSPLGNNSETQGKRIIVSDVAFNPPGKVTGLARIESLTGNSITLISPSSDKSDSLTVNSKTLVKSPQKPIEFADLNEGDLVVFSAVIDPKDPTKLTATVLMRIRVVGPTLSPEPDSASTKSSPSGSPKTLIKLSAPPFSSPRI